MYVAELCRSKAVTIRQHEELTTAAQLMRDRHVGYLVVVDLDVARGIQRPIGVLTDRDIVVSVVARSVNPRAFRVGDVMTERPIVVSDTDSLEKAIATMRGLGVRRLPVVGNCEQLLGVISLDDVIDAFAENASDVAGSMHHEHRVERPVRLNASATSTGKG